jgi:hypothetical protein
LTAEGFFSHLLEPLHSDLALCVRSGEAENAFYDRAAHVWRFPEPDDWNMAFENAAGHRRWETLLDLHEWFLGPLSSSTHSNVGSGAIIMFFRRILGQMLVGQGIVDRYDWFVVTRSDFVWPMAHPPVAMLNPARIYALNGEQYGGISDRHIVVSRMFIRTYLQLVDPIFDAPEQLRADLWRHMRRQGWGFMNPERFLAARMADLGLWGKVRFLPYVPFAVRAPGGSTRWSAGDLDPSAGYYVKYPRELARSKIAVQHFDEEPPDWSVYLRGLRGARRRFRLWRDYAAAGLLDRTMPRIVGDPRRPIRALTQHLRRTARRRLRD